MTKKSKKSTAKQIGDAVAFGKLEEKAGRVPTPKQQREAGIITAGMVAGGGAGFLAVVVLVVVALAVLLVINII